jgi:hypothetical protein
MSLTVSRYAQLGRAVTKAADVVNREQLTGSGQSLPEVYRMLRAYASNESYETIYSSTGYPMTGVRSIINPTARVISWYSQRVYPDAYTPDGLPLPDGTPSAVPFASDVEEAVRMASMQALDWGNWDERRSWYVHLGAMLGDVGVKCQLDVEAGKVYPQIIDPEHVTDIEFNARGDVISVRIEIPQQAKDERKTPYLHGEIITKETITTLMNGKPHSYDDVPSEQANPFGFCPFVWVNHRYIGGRHGAPAIDAAIRKIDELNRIVTSAHEFIDKLSKQPIGVASDKPWRTKDNPDGVHFVNAGAADTSARASIGTFKGPADMRVFPLINDIGLSPALEWARSLIGEIEKDVPETVMDEQLRGMDTVAGVAIPRLMGDVVNRFSHAQRSYDRGLITVMQMLVSMGAFAVRSGLWGRNLTPAQRLFGEFDLASYDKGDLSLSLMPRPLIRETPQERAELALLRSQIPAQETPLREAGYSREDIYGEGQVPDEVDGILTQRQTATSSVGDLLGTAFNAGRI